LIIDKLLSRCPYFFGLERILGDRPNIRPPALFDSGSGSQETATSVERLLSQIAEQAGGGRRRKEEEENNEEEREE